MSTKITFNQFKQSINEGRRPKDSMDGEREPDDNVVVHLKKVVTTGGKHDVKFDDGSRHKVPVDVAHKVLGAMGKLKPDHRLAVQDHIGKSHSNLMDVHRMIK
jgi:hypothetical protein